ncbi:hypothetical protein STEG23_003930 [Scotinomys teguina]
MQSVPTAVAPYKFASFGVQCNWFYIEVFDPLGLEFVHGNRYGSILYLLHIDIELCQHHLLKILSFSIVQF